MVAAEHPQADLVADPNLGQVAEADGRAPLRRDDRVFDVARRLDQAEPADRQRVLTPGHVAAPRVRVARRGRVEDLLQREVVGTQPVRVDLDLVLLDAAAPRVDACNTGHLPELTLEHPVLQRLELDEGHRRGLEGVAVDLADDAGQRSEGRLGVGRNVRLPDAFEHLLPSPIVVGAVREHRADVGQPEDRNRPQKRQPGDPVQLLLDRDREMPLHLLGRMARPERDHVHLDVGDVRVGLDGKAIERDDPAGRKEEHERERDEALVEREGDEPSDHGVLAWRTRADRGLRRARIQRIGGPLPRTGTSTRRSGATAQSPNNGRASRARTQRVGC